MKAIVTLVVAIFSLGAVAQQPWQKIQMPTVALHLPSSSMWMGDAAFVSTERMLSERQVDFDIVNDDALAKSLTRQGLWWCAR